LARVTQGIQSSETPREREPAPLPFPSALAEPALGPIAPGPIRQPASTVSPALSTATGLGPSAPTLTSTGSTTTEPEISEPRLAAGAPAGTAPAPLTPPGGAPAPLLPPGGVTGPALTRRMARTFGGSRSLSPMFGRQEGLQGGGLGVPGLGPGEAPDPRLVLKLIQSLMQGGG